jgi:hypothetical protein
MEVREFLEEYGEHVSVDAHSFLRKVSFLKRQKEFKKGDIVVATNAYAYDGKNEGEITAIKDKNNMPYRFEVEAYCEGLIIGRQLSNNSGKKGVLKVINYSSLVDLDPKVLDQMMFGDEASPVKEVEDFVALKKRVTNYNKRLVNNFSSTHSVKSYLKQLKPGDRMYFGFKYHEMKEITFVEFIKQKVWNHKGTKEVDVAKFKVSVSRGGYLDTVEINTETPHPYMHLCIDTPMSLKGDL